MKYYNAREARARFKEVLDFARQDKIVYIKRGNEFYKIGYAINQEECKEDYDNQDRSRT